MLDGFRESFRLITQADHELAQVLLLSIVVSLAAAFAAALVGFPVAMRLAMTRFRGRRVLVAVLQTFMAIPTVLVGLILYALFSRQGPFGLLELLYTPLLMTVGQAVLVVPLMLVWALSALEEIDPRARETALSLGASPWQAGWTLIGEGRRALVACAVAGFSRALSEVGCAMIVGGNLRGSTRTLTTSILLEVRLGNLSRAIALGLLLLAIALAVNLLLAWLRPASKLAFPVGSSRPRAA